MRPLFAHNLIVAVLIFGSMILLRLSEVASGRRSSAREDGTLEWSLVCILLLIAVSLAGATVVSLAGVATIPGAPWWPVIAGLVLMWAGLAFRAWAVFTLGRFFQLTVIVQEDHRVIERGPYRWLRHPSYLGLIVAFTGMGLAMGDWASAAILLLGTLTAFLIRIEVEERALLQELGSEYAAYTQRTARLLPGLF